MRFVFVAVLAMFSSAHAGTASAGKAAESFYDAYRKAPFTGLPDRKQMAAFAPYFSRSLQQLMKKAQGRQARCIQANPEEKGPWVEGNLFSSNFEGFTTFSVGRVQAGGSATRQVIEIRFEYVESNQKHAWNDRAVLVKQDGGWVIDDVQYGSGQAFGNGFGKGLKKSLSSPGC